MKASVVCAGVLLLFVAGEAVGFEALMTGNDIMPECRIIIRDQQADNVVEAYDQGRCIGAIAAIVTAVPGICPPRGANLGQWVRVVTQYIDNRPARLHENFFGLAVAALKATWPCR